MKTRLVFLIIVALLAVLWGAISTPVQAALGDLDPTFGTGGRVDTGVSDFVWSTYFPAPAVQQTDGRILVGGYEFYLLTDTVGNGGAAPHAVLERYTAAGALDEDFGEDGSLSPEVAGSFDSYLLGTYVGAEDEILAVGAAMSFEKEWSLYLARYDSAGVPVTGFGTDGILPVTLPAGWQGTMPFGSALQSDGMLLITGYTGISDGGYYMQYSFIMRLNPADGTLDESFGNGGVVLDPGMGPLGQITLQSDGKILVTSVPGFVPFTIRRYTAAGELDTTFADGGVLSESAGYDCSALAEGPEGKLYLTVGPISSSGTTGSNFFLARFTSNGIPDTTFGNNGGAISTDIAGNNDMSCSLLVQQDGKVIVGGGASNVADHLEPALVRYTTEGALDETFSGDGKVMTSSSLLSLIIQLAETPEGKLLATGFLIDNVSGTSLTFLLRYGAANTPPVANPGGPYLGAINTAIAFDGSGSSDADSDSLTYAWTFSDGGTSTEVAPSHSYAAVGNYEVCLTVNDGTVDSVPACTMAVVYDPSVGFVTGGGWIDSPAGAYMADPDLTGRATFGFVAKYKKGAQVPTGTTQFQFDVAGFSFYSATYEWLVFNKTGMTAQFKGSATINGGLDPNGNAYKFMLWAGDGSSTGGADTFRIKIWWEADGVENVVYDNGVNQPISAGNIVVHTGK